VGVIYQIASTGGARIATVAGLLSTGSKKAKWWIPSDKYVIKYRANEVANIAPELEIIRQLILSGEYCLVWATKLLLAAIGLVFPALVLGYKSFNCSMYHAPVPRLIEKFV
jgi:hypothetical protein